MAQEAEGSSVKAKSAAGFAHLFHRKLPVIADLNIDPPESDGEDCALPPQPPLRFSSLTLIQSDHNFLLSHVDQ